MPRLLMAIQYPFPAFLHLSKGSGAPCHSNAVFTLAVAPRSPRGCVNAVAKRSNTISRASSSDRTNIVSGGCTSFVSNLHLARSLYPITVYPMLTHGTHYFVTEDFDTSSRPRVSFATRRRGVTRSRQAAGGGVAASKAPSPYPVDRRLLFCVTGSSGVVSPPCLRRGCGQPGGGCEEPPVVAVLPRPVLLPPLQP